MLTDIIRGIMKQTTYFKKNIFSRVLINLFKPVVHFQNMIFNIIYMCMFIYIYFIMIAMIFDICQVETESDSNLEADALTQ